VSGGSRIEKASGELEVGVGISQVRVISGIAVIIGVVSRENEKKLGLVQSSLDTYQFFRTAPPSFCLPAPRSYPCDPVPPHPPIHLEAMPAHLRRQIASTGSQIWGQIFPVLDS
jgi:hypothetical protein